MKDEHISHPHHTLLSHGLGAIKHQSTGSTVMSQGIAIRARTGKVDASRLYILLKNRAVYVYPKPLAAEQQAKLVEEISKNGKQVQLKYWKNVR